MLQLPYVKKLRVQFVHQAFGRNSDGVTLE